MWGAGEGYGKGCWGGVVGGFVGIFDGWTEGERCVRGVFLAQRRNDGGAVMGYVVVCVLGLARGDGCGRAWGMWRSGLSVAT